MTTNGTKEGEIHTNIIMDVGDNNNNNNDDTYFGTYLEDPSPSLPESTNIVENGNTKLQDNMDSHLDTGRNPNRLPTTEFHQSVDTTTFTETNNEIPSVAATLALLFDDNGNVNDDDNDEDDDDDNFFGDFETHISSDSIIGGNGMEDAKIQSNHSIANPMMNDENSFGGALKAPFASIPILSSENGGMDLIQDTMKQDPIDHSQIINESTSVTSAFHHHVNEPQDVNLITTEINATSSLNFGALDIASPTVNQYVHGMEPSKEISAEGFQDETRQMERNDGNTFEAFDEASLSIINGTGTTTGWESSALSKNVVPNASEGYDFGEASKPLPAFPMDSIEASDADFVTPPVVDNIATPNEEQDDDLGDFGEASKQLAETMNTTNNNTGDMGVGDLATETTGNRPPEDDDDFGDFGDAAKPRLETIQLQDSSGDDLGTAPAGFGEASKPLPDTTASTVNPGYDDFGDFGAAPADNVVSPKEEECNDFGEASKPLPDTASTENAGYEAFGDFGTAPADNGDFGVAAFDNVASSNEDELDDFGEVTKPLPDTTNTEHASDDDFGDFGTATAENNGDFGTAPADGNVASSNEDEFDDDFGDFGEASKPLPETTNTVNAGYDDFGDFDTAPNDNGESGTAPANNVASSKEEEFDDFGDFGEASKPLPDTTSKEVAVYDDFGTSRADSTAPVSEDIDEFGTLAEGGTPHPETKEFVDADGALSTAKEKDSEPKFGVFDDVTILPVVEIDDNAKRFFLKMQSKYPFPDLSSEDEESAIIEGSVSEIIKSIESEIRDVPASKSHEVIKKALNAIPKHESKNRIIIEGDGWSPSQPFIFPVGGIRSPAKEIEKRKGRRSSVHTKVPDMLPIQLPSGLVETPLDAASPVTAKRSVLRSPAPDVPPYPNFEQKPSDVAGASSNNVERIRSKIPDLSFMLQSTLVLPKK